MTKTKLKEKIIVEDPFSGFPVALIKEGVIENYQSFEQHLIKYPDCKFKFITWNEYFKVHATYYRRPFKQIAQKEFAILLKEKNKIMLHRTLDNHYELFFSVNPDSKAAGEFHSLYLFNHKTGRYYRAVQEITISDSETLRLIKEI